MVRRTQGIKLRHDQIDHPFRRALVERFFREERRFLDLKVELRPPKSEGNWPLALLQLRLTAVGGLFLAPGRLPTPPRLRKGLFHAFAHARRSPSASRRCARGSKGASPSATPSPPSRARW